MIDGSDNRCPKCGGNIEAKHSGSITQWVAICACGRAEQSQPDDSIAPEICKTCKKRLGAGRAGSLTQWIFRSDLCSCAFPIAAVKQSPSVSGASREVSESFEEAKEIDAVAERFPIERYGPVKILGSGAGGTVYLCKDRLLKKRVAVKVLNSLTAEQLIAFQGEARAASKLNHPNVVKVLDFGVTAGGAPYMVMEVVDGKDLASIISEAGNISTTAALYIFTRVTSGLAEAHKQGIFHRDVKSSNILVGELSSREPDVRIIDFGVASFNPVDSKTIQGVTLVGTPSYMSPDQAAGKPFDARCEVYSVGCALFESLTGSTPFYGDTALEIINKQTREKAPRLSDIAPEIEFPERLEEIVAKCLEKNPDERYRTMTDLRNALHAVASTQAGEPESLEEESSGDIGSSAAARRVSPMAIAMIVVVLGIIGTFGMVYLTDKESKQAADKTKAKHYENATASLERLPDFDHFEKIKYDNANYLVSNGDLQERDLSSLPTGVDGLYILREDIACEGLKGLAKYPLKFLKINDTPVTEPAYHSIANIKSLQKVALTEMDVSSKQLQVLNALPKLETIDLTNSKLGLGTLATLGSFSQVSEIILLGVKNLGADEFTKFSNLNGLRTLDLSYSSVSSQDLKVLENLKGLEKLSIKGCSALSPESIVELKAKLPECKIIQ